jgi:putative Mg2+ transporter-C (MgtC) family protein
MMTLNLAQAGLNLFIAASLGASIGLERQWRQHLAGLRTNTLVALGAAIFITYARTAGDHDGATRIAAQVVSGIGFLGAGVIFKEGLNVRGLNTAATLWCSAAVGLLAGEGLPLYGLVAAVLVIATNVVLRPLVRVINRQPVEMTEEDQHYLISIECRPALASDIRAQLVQDIGAVPELRFSQVDSAFVSEARAVDITATVTSHKRRELALEAIVGRFADMEGVNRASWRLNPQGS